MNTTIDNEPGTATADQIISQGRGICSGYFPNTVPGEYFEVWEFNHYVYAITLESGEVKSQPLGTRW